jgi:hypothetical protein
MIIRLNNDIAFDEWTFNAKDKFWYKPLLPSENEARVVVNGIYIDLDDGFHSISFVGLKLYSIRNLFYASNETLSGYKVEETKQLIDSFLLKVSKMGAFA